MANERLREDIRRYLIKTEQERATYERDREKAREEKTAFIEDLVSLFNDDIVQALLHHEDPLIRKNISLGVWNQYGGGIAYEVSISWEGLVVNRYEKIRKYPFPAKFDEWFEVIAYRGYDEDDVYTLTIEDVEEKIRRLME